MKKREIFTLGILVIATLMSGIVLSSMRVSAYESSSTTVTKNASVTVSAACSLEGIVDRAHSATVEAGTYQDEIGRTTLKAFCNDPNGFAIYAIGFTEDTYGKTVLTDTTYGDIVTGTAKSGGTSNWAMKLEVTNQDNTNQITLQNNFNDYRTIPDEYTIAAIKTAGTSTESGVSLASTYAAYIAGTQPTGTYTGKVKYTLVHPNDGPKPVAPLKPTDCPARNICYAANANDIEGTMISESTTEPTLTAISTSLIKAAKQAKTIDASGSAVNIASNSTAILIAPNFKREGYGFAGWSTDYTATSSSTIYGPNETITTGDLSSNGLILYPVWVAAETGVTMQTWIGCSSLTPATYDSENGTISAKLDSITALKDARDDNVYAVARLADGYCWMIENLRLENTNSDNSTGTLAQGYDTGFIGLPNSENTNFDTNGTANNLYSTGDYRTMPRYNNNNIQIDDNNLTASYNTNTNSVKWYSYGNYYTWPAAKATITNYEYYSASAAVSTSICPKNWILPLGYQSTGALDDGSTDTANRVRGFSYLDRMMGGTGQLQSDTAGTTQSKKWRSFPNNFVYSGYWGMGSSASNRGSAGYYWTSVASSRTNAYHMYFGRTFIGLGTSNGSKYSGISVRCVAES